MKSKSRPTALACVLVPLALALASATGSAAGAGESRRAAAPAGQPSPQLPAGFWTGLERHEIQLKQKLLVVKGSKGIVACPYVDIAMFTRTQEALAIVPARDIDGMPNSKVKAVTPAAQALGIEVGMSGREALERIR